MKQSSLVILILYCLFCANVAAQDTADSSYAIDLEKIVITPYKTAVRASLNPSSTDVILVEELSDKGIFTLTDAIKDIPSLSYATTGSLGGITGVNVRGAEASHTQVIIDGIKLYDPMVTSRYFYGYTYMSLDNLERVEVLKGPYSSLYGSGSIGGTISLLTRKGEGKPTFSFTQESGSYQTYREKLSSQGEIDKLAYSLSVSRADINSFYSSKYKNGNHEKDPYHNFNSSLRFDYALTDDIDIGLLTNYTYAKYEYDGDDGWPAYFPADDNDNYAYFYQGVGGINLTHRLSDSFSQKVILGYTRTYRKDWQSENTHGWYDGKAYQAKWQGDYQPCDSDKIIFGFDYLRELGESRWDSTWGLSLSPKERSNTKGYYAENIFTPTDNLFLSVSFRIEDHSQFNSHNIFGFSGSYLVEQTGTKIKGSFGEGFKAPSLYQLFDGNYGNKALNPEESESYEVGLEQKIGNSLVFGSTYFHTHIKDLIDWTLTGYANSGKSRIYGIESFIEQKFNQSATVSLAYTYMNTKKLSGGTRLLRRPDNKVTCKLKTAFKKLDISTDISYVGNRMDSSGAKLKSYILGNLSFNYQVNDKFNTSLRFENVFDDDYELVNGYQTPKFSWYLGAKYTF